MKARHSHLKKGFTLVEMLVVLGIVVSLATITGIIVIRQFDKGKMVEARVMANDIAAVADLWMEHEHCFPYTSSDKYPIEDTTYTLGDTDTKQLVPVLLGDKFPSINTSEKDYFDAFPKADKNGKGGIAQASINGVSTDNNATFNAIIDPWGNFFVVAFDHSGDGKVEMESGNGNKNDLGIYDGKVWETANSVIISPGPDGEFDGINDIVIVR